MRVWWLEEEEEEEEDKRLHKKFRPKTDDDKPFLGNPRSAQYLP